MTQSWHPWLRNPRLRQFRNTISGVRTMAPSPAGALALRNLFRHPRRQVRTRLRPRLHDRRAGTGAPADDAAATRCRRGSQHRGLRLRLSRLAARRARPGAVEREEIPDARAHQVPAGRERRPRGHRDLGQPAGQPLSRRQIRRRVFDVVRQGTGRRPLRRRVQARQLRRHVGTWRRAGARRRRSCGEIVDACRTSPTTSSRRR